MFARPRKTDQKRVKSLNIPNIHIYVYIPKTAQNLFGYTLYSMVFCVQLEHGCLQSHFTDCSHVRIERTKCDDEKSHFLTANWSNKNRNDHQRKEKRETFSHFRPKNIKHLHVTNICHSEIQFIWLANEHRCVIQCKHQWTLLASGLCMLYNNFILIRWPSQPAKWMKKKEQQQRWRRGRWQEHKLKRAWWFRRQYLKATEHI